MRRTKFTSVKKEFPPQICQLNVNLVLHYGQDVMFPLVLFDISGSVPNKNL